MTSLQTTIVSSLIIIATNAIVILISSSNLFLLLKNVLPAYFTEKGKNIATREDIADITREVEKVKEEFVANTEKLRTDLQYFNQLRHSIKTEERNAIVGCYESYHVWRTTITGISFADLTSSELAMDKIADIEGLYKKLLLAESKMLLYVGRNDYSEIFLRLKDLTKDLELYVIDQCLDYAGEFIRYEEALDETKKSDKTSLRNTHHTNKVTLMKEATLEINKRYKVIEKQEEEWQVASLSKLTELSSQVNNN